MRRNRLSLSSRRRESAAKEKNTQNNVFDKKLTSPACRKYVKPHRTKVEGSPNRNVTLLPQSPPPRSPWTLSAPLRPPQDIAEVIDLTEDQGVPTALEPVGVSTAALRTAKDEDSAHPSSPPASPALPLTAMSSDCAQEVEQPRSTYLRHFEDAVETVMQTRTDYARLFTLEEIEVTRKFKRLSRAARSLYVRLFQRKGPWFRADGMLGYDEIGSGTPLWIRRRDASIAADAAGASSIPVVRNGVILEERGIPSAAVVTSSPFSPLQVEGESPQDTGDTCDCSDRSPEVARALERESLASLEEVPVIAAVPASCVTLTPQELTILHEEIQEALCELVQAGFLEGLPSTVCSTGPELKSALACVECCLKSTEINILLKRTAGGKMAARGWQGGRSSGRASLPGKGRERSGANLPASGGRQRMIEELRHKLTGQQTLWGATMPLVKEIERLVSGAVESLGVDISKGKRCNSSGGGSGGGSLSNQRGKRPGHWLVLVADGPRLVFKRALRLMYLTCDTSALSSGRVGAASVRGAGAAGAISSWFPGLAVAFGKTRYARYVCNPRAELFDGREDFLRWEAAVELRCALDGAMGELSWDRADTATGARLPKCQGEECRRESELPPERPPEVVVLDSDGELENTVILETHEDANMMHEGSREKGLNETEDAFRTAMDGLESSVAQFLPEQNIEAAPPATPAAVAIALVCARCLHALLGTSPTVLGASREFDSTAGSGEAEEDEARCLGLLRSACFGGDTPEARLESEFEVSADGGCHDGSATKEGVACKSSEESGRHTTEGDPDHSCSSDSQDNRTATSQLHTLDTKPEEKTMQREMRGKASGAKGPHTECSHIDGSHSLHEGRDDKVPEFLLQLDAGWVLASAAWEGVALLERGRDYQRAIELIIQLLTTRYTGHRRGRWWNRLSLDLAHTRRLKCALWAAEEGVRDPRVRGGDRLALEKRVTMLTTRALSKTLTPKVTTRISTCRVADTSPPGLPAPSVAPLRPQSLEDHATAVERKGYTSGDSEDEIFETPAVLERDRRRKLKRRRKKRQRLQEKQPSLQGDDEHCGDVARCARKSQEFLRPWVEKTEVIASATDSRTGGDWSKGIPSGCLSDLVERTEDEGVGDVGVHGEAPQEDGGKRSNRSDQGGRMTPSVMIPELAELSEVPDLLNDESIGAVVLAVKAAATPLKGLHVGDKSGGVGVPEISITGRRLNREVGVKSRFVGYGDGSLCTVESLVLQHLSQVEEGSWAGWHCEGSPVRGLWALLMWDVLFLDVPDVFQTPFQDAPLDLDFCPLFYLNRREAVDTRLAEIRAAQPSLLVALVAEAWAANANTVCRGLNWERTSVRYLQVVAAGLGGRALAAALAALCLNHKHFGGGLPDLLLMRAVRQGSGDDSAGGVSNGKATTTVEDLEVSTPERFASWLGVDTADAFHEAAASSAGDTMSDDRAAGGRLGVKGKSSNLPAAPPPLPPLEAVDMEGLRVEAWLLEVKGPSDRLSDRQTAWLRILDHSGARVGVCHVSEGGGGSHPVRAGTGDDTRDNEG